MPREPTPAVRRFVDGDTVKPGFQAGITAEVSHLAEDLDEHLLGDIGRFGGVLKESVNKPVNRLLVEVQKFFEGPGAAIPQAIEKVSVAAVVAVRREV